MSASEFDKNDLASGIRTPAQDGFVALTSDLSETTCCRPITIFGLAERKKLV